VEFYLFVDCHRCLEAILIAIPSNLSHKFKRSIDPFESIH